MTPEQIRALRQTLGMTQEEFARELGLDHRASVSRLESGDREPVGPLLVLLQRLEREVGEKSNQK
jgi:transcriptional regulator with XRE-family HTH domain